MKALAREPAERRLWIEDFPEPDVGIKDVLFKVRKTGIYGNDLHIKTWDEWAQKTIPVPMVVGNELVVGERMNIVV